MFGFAVDYRVRDVLKKLKFRKSTRMTHLSSLRNTHDEIEEMNL
jgi:hypothetical protein